MNFDQDSSIVDRGRNRRVGLTTESLKHSLRMMRDGRDVVFITHAATFKEVLINEIRTSDQFAEFREDIESTGPSRINGKKGTLRFVSLSEDFSGRTRGLNAVRVNDHEAFESLTRTYQDLLRENSELAAKLSAAETEARRMRMVAETTSAELNRLREVSEALSEKLIRMSGSDPEGAGVT